MAKKRGNPYHDKRGRFTTADFYTSYGYVDGKTGIEKVSDDEVWEDREEKEKERQIAEQKREAKRATISHEIISLQNRIDDMTGRGNWSRQDTLRRVCRFD